MKPFTNLLIVVLLVLLSVSALDARRKNGRKSWRNNIHRNIEIFHPKGLTIWYPKREGVDGFGVEIFVNQGYRCTNCICDICRNTTDVSSGKFIIHDDDAVIRAGDNIKYKFTFRKSDGKIGVKEGAFYVSGNRMFRRQNSLPSPTPNTNTNFATYEADINLLETIVYDAVRRCNNMTDASKNLFLTYRPPGDELEPQQLHQFTLNELQRLLPKINWETTLVNAFYNGNGVGFEVKTLIDKLKALQLAKGIVEDTISDLDELDPSTDEGIYNTEDYNEVMFLSGN